MNERVWGTVSHRTNAADQMRDWDPTAGGYRHRDCGPVDFHLFTADPYLRPLLAICEGCGQSWSRRRAPLPWRAE